MVTALHFVTILDAILKRATDAMTAPSPEMRRAIATAHTAAYYAALKERTGVLPKGLSKIERGELKARVAEQLKYYEKFAGQTEGMSDASIASRAAMYAGAVRGTYGAARNPGLPFYPTEGTECMTNCRCEWRDDGEGSFTWVLDAKESCSTCLGRADGNPYTVEAS